MERSNRAEIFDALRRYFAVNAGDYTAQLGSELLPVAPIFESLEDTPYGAIFRQAQAGNSSAAGGAATFSAGLVKPEASSILQIVGLTIVNEGATAFTANLRYLTAAVIAALYTNVSTAQMTDVASRVSGTKVGSTLSVGKFSIAVPGLATGVALRVLPDTSQLMLLPKPGICLWGNDAGGIPGAALVNSVADLAVRVGFICREWPVL